MSAATKEPYKGAPVANLVRAVDGCLINLDLVAEVDAEGYCSSASGYPLGQLSPEELGRLRAALGQREDEQ